eukprot:456186-Rhodomonas_salina.3
MLLFIPSAQPCHAFFAPSFSNLTAMLHFKPLLTELAHRHIGQPPDSPPYKVEYGSGVAGKKSFSSVLASSTTSSSDMKTQGSSTPLGKRKILSVEEQYEALKKGTID